MRLGVTLPPGDEVESARAAEAVGVPFLHVRSAPGTESVVAAAVMASTTNARVVVSVHIGDEHPTTLAEEILVLDNVSNGRIAVVAEIGRLAAEEAAEDVAVMRDSWSGRPLSHRGARWRVPAGLPGHTAPDAVMVTPAPAQLDIPLWVSGDAAVVTGRSLTLPVVVARTADVDRRSRIAPGRIALSGDLDRDRRTVVDWSAAGATHLLCKLADPGGLEALTRWLIPEVAMVGFPRVVAEARLPARWPRKQSTS